MNAAGGAGVTADAVHRRRHELAPVEAVPPAIDEAGEQSGWWATGRAWSRTYERFDPGASPYCTMLYVARDDPWEACLVETFESRPPADDPLEWSVGAASLGWVRLSRFPRDPQLQTLRRVLDRAERYTVVRYRPHRRCTLRIEAARHSFAKVFADARGKCIHAHAQALWQAAARGELGFDVAEPIAWDVETGSLWQGPVAGAPVKARLLAAGGEPLAQRLGLACASLTRATLQPATRFDARAQLERSARYAAELGARAPFLAGDARALLVRLRTLHCEVPAREPRP
ncbi:MAG: hypothetical protein ACR2RL_12685, partial [Gammaproteobacteria bacterium]